VRWQSDQQVPENQMRKLQEFSNRSWRDESSRRPRALTARMRVVEQVIQTVRARSELSEEIDFDFDSRHTDLY
jgi:hypothetical protein